MDIVVIIVNSGCLRELIYALINGNYTEYGAPTGPHCIPLLTHMREHETLQATMCF